jgi:hypothetical protein
MTKRRAKGSTGRPKSPPSKGRSDWDTLWEILGFVLAVAALIALLVYAAVGFEGPGWAN